MCKQNCQGVHVLTKRPAVDPAMGDFLSEPKGGQGFQPGGTRVVPHETIAKAKAKVTSSIDCLNDAEARLKKLILQGPPSTDFMYHRELGAIAELIRDARGPLTTL